MTATTSAWWAPTTRTWQWPSIVCSRWAGDSLPCGAGKVLAELALPFAGLMSLAPFETVQQDLRTLRTAVQSMGCRLPEPFLLLAFLALPVIPHLKITDFGLVDVDRFALLPL